MSMYRMQHPIIINYRYDPVVPGDKSFKTSTLIGQFIGKSTSLAYSVGQYSGKGIRIAYLAFIKANFRGFQGVAFGT